MLDTIIDTNFSLPSSTSTESSSSTLNICTFQELNGFEDLLALFSDSNCYRYSFGFTVFLFLANILILVFGLVGNAVVIYVVVWRLKTKTASNIFMLNMAIADMLVILCCIPATVVANLFTPWIFWETTCETVAFAQGLSVFCSVYSLVAISFDRYRAIHPSLALHPNISTDKAWKIVLGIWAVGLALTIPWAMQFTVTELPYSSYETQDGIIQAKLPFCHEKWENPSNEAIYFVLVHVIICYILPFSLITICNVYLWITVLRPDSASSGTPSQVDSNLRYVSLRDTHSDRTVKMLKYFTGLNIAFFLFWLPLYVIMARLKFFPEEVNNSTIEPMLVPIAQLLGSCNSCINPVLYALLSEKFRESFLTLFTCRCFPYFRKNSENMEEGSSSLLKTTAV